MTDSSLVNIMIFSLFQKDIFSGYRNLWLYLSFCTWKSVPLSVASIVSGDKSTVTGVDFPLWVRCPISCCVQVVFFIFSFQKFDYEASCYGFFSLFYLGFSWPPESVVLCLLPNLGVFQPLFFLVFFQGCPPLSFRDYDNRNVRSFVIVPQVPAILLVF